MKSVLRTVPSLMLAGLIAVGAGIWTTASADEASERQVVETFDQQLVETMKNADELGFEGRYKQLAPVIAETFDLDRIGKMVLGEQWKELDSDQQEQYLKMFREDTVATYASRFDDFDGESFEVEEVKDAPGDRRQVNTVIVDGDGDKTPINYVLDKDDGEWKVVNVVAKGVSDLALKRGQYTSAINSGGGEAFLQQFDKQLDKYPSIPDIAIEPGED